MLPTVSMPITDLHVVSNTTCFTSPVRDLHCESKTRYQTASVWHSSILESKSMKPNLILSTQLLPATRKVSGSSYPSKTIALRTLITLVHNIHTSQGSVVMRSRCGIFNDSNITITLRSRPMEKFRKSTRYLANIQTKLWCHVFLTHSIQIVTRCWRSEQTGATCTYSIACSVFGPIRNI